MPTQANPNSIANSERANFVFYLILFFVAGCAFSLYYPDNCAYYLPILLIIFGLLIIIYALDFASFRGFLYLSLLFFLLGIFYSQFYIKNFTKNTHFNHKLYIQGQGKIIALKEFYNPVNYRFGVNVIIVAHDITKAQFTDNKKSLEQKKKKKKLRKKVKKNAEGKTKDKVKKDKIKLSKSKVKAQRKHARKYTKKSPKKVRKKLSKNLIKKIYKNYINVANYQEIDRFYLDFKNNYGDHLWILQERKNFGAVVNQEIYNKNYNKNFGGQKFILANPPQKISLNLVSVNKKLNINDIINFKAVLERVDSKDFAENYNLKFDALAKNIDAFGFFLQEPEIIERQQINNVDAWFTNLREIIRGKILRYLDGDKAGVMMALLIGDGNYIAKNTLSAIRNSGLSHLLSISGFHLSFASAIFFVAIRWLLVRINFIALRFDIKKISAIFAIFASYFYLKIANSPLPAERALIMVWVVMLSLLLDKKFDGKRALFLALLILVLVNPYNLFQISFLLSFLGVLAMIIYFANWRKNIFPDSDIKPEAHFITDILSKIKLYFYEIIVLTFVIQIASLPILMNNFQIFSFSAFLSNLLAIPLVSFVILPLGFAIMLLMLVKLEIMLFWLIKIALTIFIKITYFFANFKYAVIATPLLSNHALALCLFCVLIFFIANHHYLRISAGVFFLLSLASAFEYKNNQIIIEKSQKFYAIYYDNDLFFSHKLKMTKQVKNWLRTHNKSDFKLLKNCRESGIKNNDLCRKIYKNYHELYFDKHKILILTKRNNIKKICQKYRRNNYEAVINLTKKFQLPQCISVDNKINNKAKIIIDNRDFLLDKTWFLEVRNDKLMIVND